jgi:ABC-type Fe3+ transport system substrate-binding protein
MSNAITRAAMIAAWLCTAVLMAAVPAAAQAPPWLVPDLLAAAKAEGGALIVYASMNEEEALPYWAAFEAASGLKVTFVRLPDAAIRARVAIEHRARKPAWDLVVTANVSRLGGDILAPFVPPQAQELMREARDPEQRWYGASANYNAPAYNSDAVKPAELPARYDDFVARTAWAGRVAIDATDIDWLAGMLTYYGEARGKTLVRDIASALKPAVIDGHLNLARQLGAGEYWLALNNYVPLTVNQKLAGAPTDFWALDPVTLVFGAVGMNSLAPHPKTALLAANFMLSREAQAFLTRRGRLPTRADVATNPAGVIEALRAKAIVVPSPSADEQRKLQQTFNEIFRQR